MNKWLNSVLEGFSNKNYFDGYLTEKQFNSFIKNMKLVKIDLYMNRGSNKYYYYNSTDYEFKVYGNKHFILIDKAKSINHNKEYLIKKYTDRIEFLKEVIPNYSKEEYKIRGFEELKELENKLNNFQ